jgi:hypothetical protein
MATLTRFAKGPAMPLLELFSGTGPRLKIDVAPIDQR